MPRNFTGASKRQNAAVLTPGKGGPFTKHQQRSVEQGRANLAALKTGRAADVLKPTTRDLLGKILRGG